MMDTTASPAGPIRVLRVIARMNIGGPARHVSMLGSRLDPSRFESLLVHGAPAPDEGSLADEARAQGCAIRELTVLGPQIRPVSDLRALVGLVRVIREFRPDLVETHTAKAGMLGRIAARLARRRRPVIIHTYHGHVLEGYFGPAVNAFYRALERGLGKISDCMVGVSQATVDDLVRLRVAPPDRFRVVSLGLELERFASLSDEDGSDFRREVGASPNDVLLAYVGRLVPIKRLDVILEALALARSAGAPVRLAVVGDGESRVDVERAAARLGVVQDVVFAGYRLDVAPVLAACDVAVLSSDNEGTPVSLIEAGAAGRPSVATAVGGVSEVVAEGSGILVSPGDPEAFAAALVRLAGDPALRREMGERARAHVLKRFPTARLITDMEVLYEELLLDRRLSRSPSR